MTVEELINELKKYPKDKEIKIMSYENSFNTYVVKEYSDYVQIFLKDIDDFGRYLH